MSANRIKAARELLGLNQGQLAAAAGLSQGLISQIERGHKPATDEVLQAVARCTGLPPRFFDKTTADIGDSLRFRKYRTASAKDTARAHRTFAELADAAAELMDWAQLPEAAVSDRASELLTSETVEQLATITRSMLNLGEDQPIRHLTRTLENAAIAIAPIIFAELSGDERDEVAAVGHFGMSTRTEPTDRLLIGYFPSSGDRQRFTLAHELGHLLLHRGTAVSGREEREADRFAGALLLPAVVAARLLGPQLTLRDYAILKAEWGMSIQALVMRAYHLEAINDHRRTSLYKQISARGWRHNEPVLVRHEEPALLGTLLRRRYGGAPNMYLTAADQIGLPPVLLRSTMPQLDRVRHRNRSSRYQGASVTELRQLSNRS